MMSDMFKNHRQPETLSDHSTLADSTSVISLTTQTQETQKK